MKPQFVISCHADTGFRAHRLRIAPDGRFHGQLDNFAGVYAVMRAYFSGGLNVERVRIELTHGEEADMAGARDVCATLGTDDTVVVVDVTGAPTAADITIEKCANPEMRKFVQGALKGMAFELFEGCPDPIADSDESDIYSTCMRRVCFLGIPCRGGDYNAGPVFARPASIEAASQALVLLAKRHARSGLSVLSPPTARSADSPNQPK